MQEVILANRIACAVICAFRINTLNMEFSGAVTHCGAAQSRPCLPTFQGLHAPRRLQARSLQAQPHSASSLIASGRERGAAQLCRAEIVESAAAASPEAGPSGKSVPTSTDWEMDFCSRPVLDERGKKMWELLICDADRTFEHAEYFPNNKINSTEVRFAGRAALST